MIGCKHYAVLLVSVSLALGGATIQPSRTRHPRLMFISSTSTSVTYSTTTVCFYSGTTAVTSCAGKRKRALLDLPDISEDIPLEIAPQRLERQQHKETEDQLVSSIQE